jgi:hypothetical protein
MMNEWIAILFLISQIVASFYIIFLILRFIASFFIATTPVHTYSRSETTERMKNAFAIKMQELEGDSRTRKTAHDELLMVYFYLVNDHADLVGLVWACIFHELSAIIPIIDGAANNEHRLICFYFAIAFGKMEIVKYLCETWNVDPEAKSPWAGWNALHFASVYGRLDIIKYLSETHRVDTEATTRSENVIKYRSDDCDDYCPEPNFMKPQVFFNAMQIARDNGYYAIINYLWFSIESESIAEQADDVFIVGGSDDNDDAEDQVPAPPDVVFIVQGSDDNDEVNDQVPTSPSPPVPPSPPTPPPAVDSHPPPQRRSRRIAMMTPPVLRRSPRLALLPRVSYVGMF